MTVSEVYALLTLLFTAMFGSIGVIFMILNFLNNRK